MNFPHLPPMRIDSEWTREQRSTVEALSLEHGNANCYLYRAKGIRGRLLHAVFADGYGVNIDENGGIRR